MYIESHAITCPACHGHRYVGHTICTECLGVGEIVFFEREQVLTLRRRIVVIGLACFGTALGFSLAWIYPLLHRWLVRMGL